MRHCPATVRTERTSPTTCQPGSRSPCQWLARQSTGTAGGCSSPRYPGSRSSPSPHWCSRPPTLGLGASAPILNAQASTVPMGFFDATLKNFFELSTPQNRTYFSENNQFPPCSASFSRGYLVAGVEGFSFGVCNPQKQPYSMSCILNLAAPLLKVLGHPFRRLKSTDHSRVEFILLPTTDVPPT